MKEINKDTSIVFIGAGNLATNLAKALHAKGFKIEQIYSRTEESASVLASFVGARWTTDLNSVAGGKDLYIVSLKDDAFLELLARIVEGREDALFVHTAGSVSMDVWKGKVNRYGVFYPLQTFSKQREVVFDQIPIFIEAADKQDKELLKGIASLLTQKVYTATSDQRKSLHLAAVFACNFANHMYVLAAELLEKNNLQFDVLLPLIDETAHKVHSLSPKEAQTGPAVRYDEQVIYKHLVMLEDEPAMRDLYRIVSQSIHIQSNSKK